MTTEQQADRAAEMATDAAHDAYSVPDPGFIYDAKSWDSDCACLITDSANNESLRYDVAHLLDWIAFACDERKSAPDMLFYMERIDYFTLSIGGRVIKNLIARGITLENIGKVD